MLTLTISPISHFKVKYTGKAFHERTEALFFCFHDTPPTVTCLIVHQNSNPFLNSLLPAYNILPSARNCLSSLKVIRAFPRTHKSTGVPV